MDRYMTKTRRSLSMSWLSFIFFIFLGFSSQANVNVISKNINHSHVWQENPHITIGVLAFRPKALSTLQWQPLEDYLNQNLPSIQFNLKVFTFPELQRAIDNKTIDFLLTNSANYIQLTHKYGLSAPLASLINKSNDSSLFGFGGAIIIHKDNSSIKQLIDLQGKRIATPSFESFGGYMMQAYELQKIGLKIKKDLQFLETGMPHDTAITALLNKQVDAAFVRTGVLESLRKESPLAFNQLQIINPSSELFPFMLSTRLYPEWPFAALPHTNSVLSGQITGLLLTLEHNSITTQKIGIHGFSIPADYEPIREVLRSLRVYPYEANPEFTFEDIWTQYSLEIIGILLIAIIIILLSINLMSTNKRLKSHKQILEEQASSLAIAAVAFNTQQAILIATPDEKIIRVNQAFSDITGYQANEVIGKTPRIFKSGHHPIEFYNKIWKTLKKEGFWQGEIWNRRKSGEIYPVGQSIKAIKNSQGEITHYLSTFTDITQHKENEDKIRKLAFYDPLTNLANRRLLKDHLQQTMVSSDKDGFYFAIIFIDLDNFKTLNDTLGHHYGDLLLQQLAKRLTACVSDGDTVCRPGGDEFILLIPNISTQHHKAMYESQHFAEKVLSHISQPYSLADKPYSISASLGISIAKGHQKTLDELCKHSDLAMYQSKTAGKNTISFFDPEMQEAVDKRSVIEHDLRIAIDEQQFQLFYQPKQSKTGETTGYEALIRWHHPTKKLISPIEFIPVAEETGLIIEIGYWVIKAACRQLNLWALNPETENLNLAINVSERQLRQDSFVENTLNIFDECDINPNKLEIEITESQLMENIELSVQKMHALKAAGVSFALDDFGTGYSSLVYLKSLPISTLKVDQSFVKEMLDNSDTSAIVMTIISLAKTLELQLVAEGIENEEQKTFLINAGCDYLQGYLLGHPQPINKINQ